MRFRNFFRRSAEPAKAEPEPEPAKAEPVKAERTKPEPEPVKVEQTKPEPEPAEAEQTKPEPEPVEVAVGSGDQVHDDPEPVVAVGSGDQVHDDPEPVVTVGSGDLVHEDHAQAGGDEDAAGTVIDVDADSGIGFGDGNSTDGSQVQVDVEEHVEPVPVPADPPVVEVPTSAVIDLEPDRPTPAEDTVPSWTDPPEHGPDDEDEAMSLDLGFASPEPFVPQAGLVEEPPPVELPEIDILDG